ncbi:septum formation inhibitor Maf [Veronia nyctiphanis]|uniref:7-methyl-GTP pyrophosphatase n=1 Tax=Veronia nyctiphanis TaxID=1278244 RepID=A0A4Q0Z0F1_9GAMM|nr:nucleoside triphosphate pyrophosphatase [Veronia nyctiphanis]RXJ74899.1 septum formation inhibitor Maf [Veronia nyctiphanis]
MAPSLILASGSKYRAELLGKLSLPFTTHSPDIDETPLKNESAQTLVKRLAETKARACEDVSSNALIIGSDQVCVIDGLILGKPHTDEKAIKQLLAASGKKVTFYTGLCLYNTSSQRAHLDVEAFHVHFRFLSQEEIETYVKLEQPLDCAGSFKSEGLGISLFERLEGRDPNTLIGLPLIRLLEMLKDEGVSPLLGRG